MWCRAILTAVAISYVICMLLLSGLQKEDLDANTLEKLRRHNVNIDDMNNGSRRQECLLNFYPDKGNNTQKQITTQNLNETLGMSTTNKSVKNDAIVGDYPKRVQEVLKLKNIIQNEIENNKTRFFKQLQIINENFKINDVIDSFHNLENVTKVEENNGLKIEYNMQNKPDLQSLMNFWTKLTHYTKTVVTEVPTTPTSPYISEEKYDTVKIETSPNNGYVHSREMEFISRMLAEYLASQNIPTTTQQMFTRKAYKNYIPKNIEEIKKTTPIYEEPAPTFPTENNAINDNLSKVNEHPRNIFYNYMAIEVKGMPFKLTYDSNRQIQSTEDTPYYQIIKNETKTGESKPVEKYNPIRFLDKYLQMKNDFYINGEPFPYTETTTKSTTFMTNEDNEQQEKSETFDVYHLFKYMKGENDSNTKNVVDKLKNAPTDAVVWEPMGYNRMKNKQFRVMPIDTKETAQKQNFDINNVANRMKSQETENFGIYGQYKGAPSNIDNLKRIKNVRINRFNDISTYINKSEQIQNVKFNNNRFKSGPSDIEITKQTQNLEMDNYPFKYMLPSMKRLNQNQYLKLDNNQLKVTRPEMNKLEQIQNFGTYGDQYRALLAATNESERNQISKMNFQFNANPAITKNLEQNSKGFSDNRFKFMPAMIKKSEQTPDSRNEFKTIPANINNSEQNQTYVNNNKQLQAKKVYMNNEQHTAKPVYNEQLQDKPVYLNNKQLQFKPVYNQLLKDKPVHMNNAQLLAKPVINEQLLSNPVYNQQLQDKPVHINNQQLQSKPVYNQQLQDETGYTNNEQHEATAVYMNIEQLQSNPVYNQQLQDKPLYTNNEQHEAKPVYMNNEQLQAKPVYNEQLKAKPVYMNNEELQANPVYNEQLQAKPIYNEQYQAQPVYMKNEQLQAKPNDERKSKQNFQMNINEPQAIPANIIKEIAEKVKHFFLRDIEKDISTTTVKTTSSTTTTAVPTTITLTTIKTTAIATEKPSILHKDITKGNHVMQRLMEIINEYNAMKETVKSTTQVLQNTTTTLNYGTTNLPKLSIQTYPRIIPGFNPYIMKSPPVYVKPIETKANSYVSDIVPLALSSGVKQNQTSKYVPQLHFKEKNGSHSAAITIQTNSYEIAPLAIQILKPMKVINQHIIVTTKTPEIKQKEKQERENKNRLDQYHKERAEIGNHREKLQFQSDFTKQVRFANSLKRPGYRDRYSYKSRFRDREKPNDHHEYNDGHIEKSNPPGSPSYLESLNYPGRLSHIENFGPPKGYSHSDGSNYPEGWRSHSGSYNDPVNYQDGTRHRTGSYRYTGHERQYPRYEGTKFHEKLERIEKWPRSSWRNFRTKTTENCCSEVPARQLMPLTKVKQRTRFDDTHFKNFLKSQQKVTDMLEKILANNNIKTSGPHSVETT